MSKFKVGDVCVIRDNAFPEFARGLECAIIGDEDWYYTDTGPVFAYRIHIASVDAQQITAIRGVLMPKRPPSWNDWLYDTSGVKDECPWQPARERV